MAKQRILLVDDHPIVRHGLRNVLASDPEIDVCGEADDAPEALQQVAALRPDAVVLDISLKTSQGLELIGRVRAAHAAVRILVWSMFDETLFAERALRAGATGYVGKQEPIENVVAALRQILRGEPYLSSQMTNRMLQRVTEGRATAGDALAALTNRELEVFELIGRGLTTQKIAHQLQLSVKTVEGYREKIKAKLHVRNAAELMQQAVAWFLEKSRSPP